MFFFFFFDRLAVAPELLDLFRERHTSVSVILTWSCYVNCCSLSEHSPIGGEPALWFPLE